MLDPSTPGADELVVVLLPSSIQLFRDEILKDIFMIFECLEASYKYGLIGWILL
jgi:hypothetical protein